ncbi:MAG: Asp-tRNA(Asn)/Glu-tRNA(Gln) amidotransferase subunit GatB, partial [Actinomycetota bacterium]|nr:Asp-tRNA(Asn)/Glu-tRNA(Gln) amidotransferase subunit GatB [Actinomycetota bacterium]
ANVSVRENGENNLRTRCEIKNVNSLKSLGRAIEYEANRHISLYENGESPKQETRHWDEDAGRTRSGRSKEDAEDYRYFTEPDLVPLNPSKETIAKIDQEMPELPSERRGKLADLNGIKSSDMTLLVERDHDAFALDAIKGGGEPEKVVKHLVNNLSSGLGALTPEALAQLVQMENKSEITSTQAKKVLGELVQRGGMPANLATELGFEVVGLNDLEKLVDQLINEHSDEWERFCSGDTKVQGFFVGQVMKSTSGQADGKIINQILNERATSE